MWKTTKKSTLPQQLRLTDPGVREQLEALPASQVLIGLGTDRQPVGIDLDTDSPHVLVCSTSGGGTSTALRTLAAQVLHHGGDALILDTKCISQTWARGLPGVTYHHDIAGIHNTLLGLRAEPARHVDAHGETVDLPHLAVVFESAGHTLRQLARHWDKARQAGEPKTSLAVDAYEELLYAGREARIHILAGAQSYSAALGREQFSTLLLGRVTPRTWNQAAPQVAPSPRPAPTRAASTPCSTPPPTPPRSCS
ncbi:hypothetical protein ACWCXX_39595 [Streptomyces sp. NPDC001732]